MPGNECHINEGYCSCYDFAKAIFEISNIKIKVNPIETNSYPSKAERPKNSRLSKGNTDKEEFNRLPHWEDALNRFLTKIL
ncbi:TPA: sugar nucleotide-binding protein [Streptococcus suis]|nr:sugar nucleotide-binding protein [Streptococcus suis]